MSKAISRLAILAGLSAVLSSFLSAPALANWWERNKEREGSCYIPNMQTSFHCNFGPYRTIPGARQIGGFYVNPRNDVDHSTPIPLEYRLNGTGQWTRVFIQMNATSGNYIDFGDGVQSFEYRFPRPDQGPLRGGGGTIHFTFNYDLDR